MASPTEVISWLKAAGWSGEDLRKAWAITMRESHGNPAAHNTNASTGDNSYGLFQINMLGNLGPQRDAAFRQHVAGYTGPDSLLDPVVNARAAHYMSNGGKNLAAWDINKNGYNGGTHAAAFQQWYNQFPGDKGIAAASGTGQASVKTQTGPKSPTDPKLIAGKYAMSWAIINSDPGLKQWFDGFAKKFVAANGQISQDEFNLELNKQAWWQQHSANYIKDVQQSLEHPVDYEQALQGDVSTLRAEADQMGAQVDDTALKDLAIHSRQQGWNQSQVQSALSAYVTASGSGDYTGQAGQSQDELNMWAAKNGVTLSPTLVGKYMQGIASGSQTIDDVKGDIRKTYMAGSYPAWADKINAGFDIADLAAPYQQMVQNTLENPNVGLDDPLMKKLMQGTDAQGQPRQVPLYEAEQVARSDPRWQQTNNAYSLAANAAHNVLKTWGFE